MDVLAELLGSGTRSSGGLFHQVVLAPPWAVRVQDEAPLALAAMVRGDGWIVPDGGEPLPLGEGDIAVVRGPAPYVLADHPSTAAAPGLVILPGDCCTTPSGRDLCEELRRGVRTWGSTASGPSLLLSGVCTAQGDIDGTLRAALPDVLVLGAKDWDSTLLTVVTAEVVKDGPGQQIVLDRLLDLLLISVLRAWFARPEAQPPDWYRAQGDPVVGAALRLLHEQPAHHWTVASLAAGTGVSRAALARRFTAMVGEPPMSYLTRRRLDLAARLLRDTDATLASVAHRVGYADAFALSAAFKRVHGMSPTTYRTGR